MKKVATIMVCAGLLVGAAPATAKKVSYVGKTSAGHKITFKVKGSRIYNPVAGIPTTCLPIQGGGAPQVGVDVMHPLGWVKLGESLDFYTEEKPFAFYNEVKLNQRFTSKGRAGGQITGALRMQYQFMVPKFTPGTFSIYSCLGEATFKASPKR